MPGPTWGTAEIEVTADGRVLPAQIRTISAEAGESSAAAFAKEFNKRLKALGPSISRGWGRVLDRIRVSAAPLGRVFRNIFTPLGRSIRSATKDLRGFGSKWRSELSDLGSFSLLNASVGVKMAMENIRESADRLGRGLRNISSGWERAMSGLRKSTSQFGRGFRNTFGRLGRILRDTTSELSGFSGRWKGLSANTRQWTLIIGAVIASLSELAGLASAAGSGLLVLGGAFAGFAVGAGTAFAAFKVFGGDIKKLPAALKPARSEMDKFVDSFDKLGDAIAVAAFEDTSAAWASLRGSVEKLTPAFESVGKIVGGLFKDFSKSISDNEKQLDSFVRASGRIFDRLVRAVGRVADALLDAFVNPNFQRSLDEMLGWIDELADGFSNFLRGPGFDEWLNHGRDVFGAFGELLSTTGTLLNNLVTDDSIGKLVAFIDNIDGFLKGPGEDLLKFFEELDVFGLLAEALNKFGDALAPLGKPMRDLAKAFNDVVQSGIDTFVPVIQKFADFLAPLAQAVADFMAAHPREMGRVLGLIATGLAAIVAVKITASMIRVIGSLFTVIGSGTSSKNTKSIGKYTAALGGLAVGVSGLVEATDSAKQKGVGDILAEMVSPIAGGAIAGAQIGGGWGALIGGIVGGLAALVTQFTTSFDDILNINAEFWLTLTGNTEWLDKWKKMMEEGLVPSNIVDMLPIIGEQIKLWWDGIILTFQIKWAVVLAGFQAWWIGITTGWSDFLNGIKTNVETWWNDISTGFQNWWNGLTTGIQNWWNGITLGWNNFWSGLATSLSTWWSSIMTTIRTWWTRISTGFSGWWNGIKTGWSNFWNGLSTNVRTGWNKVTSFLSNAWNGLKASWNNFWNGLRNVVGDVFNGIVNTVRGPVNTVIGIINGMINKINDALGALRNLSGGLVNIQIPNLPGMASGGVLTGPRRILAGEAGPEAIVPLNRALSQVDPSVRWLSAIAQNKPVPAMASGGIAGTTRNNTFEAGAIVVQETSSALATGIEVLNRISNNLD